MVDSTSTFLSLQTYLRPPRLLVVAPQTDHWVPWIAAALRAAGRVWGGCASVVLPASVATDPQLDALIRQFSPDHIVAYLPLIRTVASILPGHAADVIDTSTIAPEQLPSVLEMLADERSPHESVADAESAAAVLRERHGVMTYMQESEVLWLNDSPGANGPFLPPAPSLSGLPLTGVPWSAAADSLSALAFALRVGVHNEDLGLPDDPTVTEEQYGRAALDDWSGLDAEAVLTKLGLPAGAELRTAHNPQASRCVQIERGFVGDRFYVVGDEPLDFAVAALAQRVFGHAVWAPSTSGYESLGADIATTRPRRSRAQLIAPSGDQKALKTAADAALKHHKTRHSDRPARFTTGSMPKSRTQGRCFIAIDGQWDIRHSMPVRYDKETDRLLSLSPMPINVPPEFHPNSHPWCVSTIAEGLSVPPHPNLSGDALEWSDDDVPQTHIRASEGGISYVANRYDLVPAGASLAGTLASPQLAWPLTPAIIRIAASPAKVAQGGATRRTELLERLVGGREPLESITVADSWAILTKFLPDKNPSEGDVRLSDRTVLTFQSVRSAAPSSWTDSSVRDYLDDLISRKVLRRGLVLRCQGCWALDCFPLAAVSEGFECRRCGDVTPLLKAAWRDGNEPPWFYDLHAVMIQAVQNDADVPLASTRHLRSLRPHDGIHASGEFELVEDTTPFVELDFMYSNGRHLFVGEAKKNNVLAANKAKTLTELNKLLRGVETMQATGLVLATKSPEWSALTLDVVRLELQTRREQQKVIPLVLQLTDACSETPHLRTLDDLDVSQL